MVRIVLRASALIALGVGYWYMSTGNCDMWGSQPIVINIINLVMAIGYVCVIWKNVFKGKSLNGAWSITFAVLTSIYWYELSWLDQYIFACKGPKAILIGGITMFLLFIVNLVVDFIEFAITQRGD